MIETHDFGHNFGPPRHQSALLGRMARFMLSSAKRERGGGVAASDLVSRPLASPPAVGTDTYASGVSPELEAKLSPEVPISELWDSFCTVQTAADTTFALSMLLDRLGLAHLQGQGLSLFLALRPALEAATLKFSQKKLLADLHASFIRAQKVVVRMRTGKLTPDEAAARAVAEETAAKCTSGGFGFNEILVCGAGPVGLRAACELALLGFRVTVVEKRPNFSRANILTFWDATMSDILALGAKSYFPDLKPTGNHKVLGTRQIQVCLLKTLLLFGGTVHYGMEICGLVPPSGNGCGGKWCASFCPYVKHRRTTQTEAQAKQTAAQERGENEAPGKGDSALATEFQQAKDYGGKEVASVETWVVDDDYINGRAAIAAADSAGLAPIPFDAYVIAEGGWSDTTRKLGFSKSVELFKPVFGLVANLEYNPLDLKERNMRSKIHFVLEQDWPLSNCPIQAEFIEYLKGETHFFALVVSKKNHHKDNTDSYLERMTQEQRNAIPDEMIQQLRRQSLQKGLVEMGVFRRSYASGLACLAPDNVDMERLIQMMRDITTEMGLPVSTPFYATNPVQLFDFSRRARCIEPVRVLSSSGGGGVPAVVRPDDFLQAAPGGVCALVLPVGDALQEPVWTQGLGINRGFHTAMNQAFACLKAREIDLQAAVCESCTMHDAVGCMRWGAGHSGLAGSGSGAIGLKPFKEWDTDPRNRLPIK